MLNTKYEFRQVQNKSVLREVLGREPVSSAYLLGDLDEPFFGQCRWFVGFYRSMPLAVVVVFEGLSVHAVLTYGAPDMVEGVLKRFADVLPKVCYAKFPLEHKQVFLRHYGNVSVETMWNMGLSQDKFTPLKSELDIRRLTSRDPLESILKVYDHYPDHFFEPCQLETGVYFGLFFEEQLMSISGTHVYAPREGIAVLGNIVTHKEYRNRGYSHVCTAKLLKYLFEHGCGVISLQVGAENLTAIACYRHLGFKYYSTVLQARCA
jgi:RimJ/RimL family protein N-acetyltransferase